MKRRQILINASNLHVGGGLQVASAVLEHIALGALQLPDDADFHFAISNAVRANLATAGIDHQMLRNVTVYDSKGWRELISSSSVLRQQYDVVFTIFGPLYSPRQGRGYITGFAQAWILVPSGAYGYFPQSILSRLKFELQWIFFRLSGDLIVETDHVRRLLCAYRKYPEQRILVAPNCIGDIFRDRKRWVIDRFKSISEPGVIRIGYLGRDYPHKNLGVLLEIDRVLNAGGRRYRFYVTLSPSEWRGRSPEFRRSIANVGEISTAECPPFYEMLDAAICPSLLECSSALPLESIYMGRPLFCSDRAFHRDALGQYANYFDPLDAISAARLIDDWFHSLDDTRRERFLTEAKIWAESWPTALDRSKLYLARILSRCSSMQWKHAS